MPNPEHQSVEPVESREADFRSKINQLLDSNKRRKEYVNALDQILKDRDVAIKDGVQILFPEEVAKAHLEFQERNRKYIDAFAIAYDAIKQKHAEKIPLAMAKFTLADTQFQQAAEHYVTSLKRSYQN